MFDSPEMSDGLGLLRTLVWIRDYGEVYGSTPAEMSAVVVLRHNAIWMVMNDEFWSHSIRAATGRLAGVRSDREWAGRLRAVQGYV